MEETTQNIKMGDNRIQEIEDSQEGKYLTFHLANEDYGIEIRHVTEIIGIQSITEVPEMADCIRGVINLRGKVIPVMDVRTRFNLAAREYDERTCIVVVNIAENVVGLVVDQVQEVADIPGGQMEPPPFSCKEKNSIKSMGKIGDKVKIILDVEKLLEDDDLNPSDSSEEESLSVATS